MHSRERFRKRAGYESSPTAAVLQWLFIVFAIYLSIACVRYQFAHPEKTQTQRFLEIPEAIFWE